MLFFFTRGAPLAPIAPDQSDASPPGDLLLSISLEKFGISFDLRRNIDETWIIYGHTNEEQ